MSAKALEAGALVRLMRLMMGAFRQVGTRQGQGHIAYHKNREIVCVSEVHGNGRSRVIVEVTTS